MTVEDILDNGKVLATKDFGITDHNALVEKIILSGRITSNLGEASLKNLADYWQTLPSEVAMKLFTELGKQNVAQSITFHKTVASNGVKNGDYLVRLLTGKN